MEELTGNDKRTEFDRLIAVLKTIAEELKGIKCELWKGKG